MKDKPKDIWVMTDRGGELRKYAPDTPCCTLDKTKSFMLAVADKGAAVDTDFLIYDGSWIRVCLCSEPKRIEVRVVLLAGSCVRNDHQIVADIRSALIEPVRKLAMTIDHMTVLK